VKLDSVQVQIVHPGRLPGKTCRALSPVSRDRGGHGRSL